MCHAMRILNFMFICAGDCVQFSTAPGDAVIWGWYSPTVSVATKGLQCFSLPRNTAQAGGMKRAALLWVFQLSLCGSWVVRTGAKDRVVEFFSYYFLYKLSDKLRGLRG